MSYTDFDYQILVKQLRQCADEKYKEFHSGLSVGSSFLYGVRVPELRKIANRIIPRDWKGFLSVAKDDSYEEILIQGLVISQINCPIEEQLEYVTEFVEKIDNWAICDIFCSSFKAARKYREIIWKFIMNYIDAEEEFKRRFAVVMLMEHFFVDEYIDSVLKIIVDINKKDYYVMMAAAWAISISFIKYREKTIAILKEGVLDSVTQNKAIQKCRESFRITAEDKELLKTLKMKP